MVNRLFDKHRPHSSCCIPHGAVKRRLAQCLLEIGQQVALVFDADGQANHVVADSQLRSLVRGYTGVGKEEQVI